MSYFLKNSRSDPRCHAKEVIELMPITPITYHFIYKKSYTFMIHMIRIKLQILCSCNLMPKISPTLMKFITLSFMWKFYTLSLSNFPTHFSQTRWWKFFKLFHLLWTKKKNTKNCSEFISAQYLFLRWCYIAYTWVCVGFIIIIYIFAKNNKQGS